MLEPRASRTATAFLSIRPAAKEAKREAARIAKIEAAAEAKRQAAEKVEAESFTRFGGVKRAPRGNSMGQMGQWVRHG
jgi:hypothetical protein